MQLELIMVRHNSPKSLPGIEKEIQAAIQRGAKRIAIEQELTFEQLQHEDARTGNPRVFDYYENIELVKDKQFFGKLADFAKSKGIEVTRIGSFYARNHAETESLKATKVLMMQEKITPTLKKNEIRRAYSSLIAGAQDDKIMIKQLERNKPDVVIAGGWHGAAIAKHFRVPSHNIKLFGASKIKLGVERIAINAFLAHRRLYKTVKRRKRSR